MAYKLAIFKYNTYHSSDIVIKKSLFDYYKLCHNSTSTNINIKYKQITKKCINKFLRFKRIKKKKINEQKIK